MRKLLLLIAVTGFSWTTSAQINTVLFEDFESPSGADKIDTTFSTPVAQGSYPFSISNMVATSGTQCYRAIGNKGSISIFHTVSFSTVGFRYTSMTFNHIAKVSALNGCYLQYSINGGQTWNDITGANYNGESAAYASTGFFNESSYFTKGDPWFNGKYGRTITNAWWRNESFDLSDLVFDVANNVGYPNVMIRFEMRFTNSTPIGAIPAGWFIDDIEITQATCELEPPKADFTSFQPIPCYPLKPENGIPSKSGDKYPIGVVATDPGSGIDQVKVIYSKNGGPFITKFLPLFDPANDLYQDTLYNIAVGDTVEYYYEITDNSCPNLTVVPAIGPLLKFWPELSLPPKCGIISCDKFPEHIDIDSVWIEDFEGARWGAGNGGATTAGGLHRGTFPVFPDGGWVVAPSTAPQNDSKYAWCVNIGGTASPATGPDNDNTSAGNKYIYAESSLKGPTFAQLITPCIDLTKETRCLAFEFYYHMFGSDVDLLRVDIDTGLTGAEFKTGLTRLVGQQQSGSGEPWKRALFSLEEFNGTYIRIRFMAKNSNAGVRGDIAIDDLRIFEPEPVDMELLSVDDPVNGYCFYSNTEPVKILLRNNGCQAATDIPVGFQVNNNPIKWDTVRSVLELGDTLSYTFTPTADMFAFDTYWIKAFVNMPFDSVFTNNEVSIADSIEYNQPITTFPYIEDFEDGVFQSQILGNRNFRFDDGIINFYRWIINEGLTPTRETGPFQGFGYGGKYVYSESLGNDNQMSSTFLRSICMDLGSLTSPALEFYYHMNGESIDKLEVQVSRSDEDLETWTNIATLNPPPAQGFVLADWRFRKISLSAYAGETIKIRFKASRKELTPFPENGDQTDIAIDKIMVIDEIANDAGVLTINQPELHVRVGTSLDPVIRLTNHGTSPISSVPVTVSITPLCGPNTGISTTYSGTTNASSVSSGATSGQLTLSGLNIAWPDGEYEMCVITQLGGDTHAFNDTICKRLIGHTSHAITFETEFDDCDYSQDGFHFEGDLRQWELGRPTGTRIRNAYSSPNAWVTNLNGTVLNNTEEILYVPALINFDTIEKARLRFRQNMDFNRNPDDVKQSQAVGGIEFFDDATNTWDIVGRNIPTFPVPGAPSINWYKSEFGSPELNLLSGPGFVGRTNGAWIQSSYALLDFNYITGENKFRFRYISTDEANPGNEGWGIDDFELYVPPQNSVGIVKVTHVKPIAFPKQVQSIRFSYKNTGAKNLEEFKLKITIDDVDTVVDTTLVFPPAEQLQTSQSNTIIFPDVWKAPNVTVGRHKVEVITSRPNQKQDNLTIDDDTIVYFTVLDTVDLRLGSGDTIYCNDFERLDPDVTPWLPINSYTYQDGEQSWQHGFPNQFGFPPSGQNVWVTGIDDDYHPRDSSSLLTPIFLIDSGQALEVSFSHWFRTEQYHDGGNFEVSFDGGLSWQPIGFSKKADTNWYNTPFVTALNIIRPGWTDDSEGWIDSDWTFSFNNEVKCIFRFRFESDFNIEDNGWAIDDFCLKHTKKGIREIIGTDELEAVTESIVSQLSPNPSTGISELSLSLPTPKDAELVVFNAVGQIMEKRNLKLQDGLSTIEINGSRWESGMYIVKLYVEEDLITKKLIISH